MSVISIVVAIKKNNYKFKILKVEKWINHERSGKKLVDGIFEPSTMIPGLFNFEPNVSFALVSTSKSVVYY